MLVNKPYNKDQIVSFKLINGDEIVAKIVDDTSNHYVVNKPCTVMSSQQGFGLMQSLMTSELNTNIPLNKDHIMMHAPTVSEMVNHYILTTTGIEPVTAGSIIQ